MDHGDFDPSLARAWIDLVVPSKATVVAQPCEGSLHDPTPWQNGKANLSPWFANDIEHKLSRLLRPFLSQSLHVWDDHLGAPLTKRIAPARQAP